MTKFTSKKIEELIEAKLSHNFGVTSSVASNDIFYKACVLVIKDIMKKQREEFEKRANEQEAKQVFYLCMEFLMGRSFKNALYNLNLESTFKKALSNMGAKLEKLYELEPDAGLGNGGLGRLAACILDGLANGEYFSMGYSIRYEYGIFRQKLVDGWQAETPDFWLPGGEIWFEPRPEEAVDVSFDGHVNEWWDGTYHHIENHGATIVKAVPYDMMIPGKDGDGVAVLRLWEATKPGFDMALFNQGDYLRAVEENAMAEAISKVLYPADNHYEGKSLRLRQQYFLVSASIQDIVHRHLSKYGTMENFAEKVAIHINDTHPALSIPELMRIMLDECGYTWDEAWAIVTRTVGYTNHTVMVEALECWNEELFRQRLPRIYQIVQEINRRYHAEVLGKTGNWDLANRTSIIDNKVIRMANLSVAGSYSVNGVSRLHSDILKESVFHDFYTVSPEKFCNVTNGIAHRRWLCQANPELTAMIKELIGDGFVKNAAELEGLMNFTEDKNVLTRLADIKRNNKQRFVDYIKSQGHTDINVDSIFDVQVKRLHEYKRQQMNALHILTEYLYIKNNPNAPFTPKTYIFGAKAAPGYYVAKQIIQMIYKISKMIDNDPDMKGKLKVVYIEDYRVTMAELLMPAAEISEQISLAGTEASGTGNMKFMLNGAITLGTEDGANVEIHEAVGDDNIIIFGMEAHEVDRLKANGYNPMNYYNNNPQLREVVDLIGRGIDGMSFENIKHILLSSDTYMAFADYADYCNAHQRAYDLYANKEAWNKASLVNIAKSGRFAIDRLIDDYANTIWNLKRVEK